MKFTEKQYLENLDYIEALFTLGGLSECGKTSAGKHFESLGIKRGKIIKIEREMMEDRGYDLSDGMKNEYFIELYLDQENAFREFLFRLIEHMKAEGITKISIESLYRAPLGAFLKKELGDRCSNIYIEAPIEARAYREMLKVNAKAIKDGTQTVTLDEMVERVKNKDKFKEEHNASDCRDIADYIVDNSSAVTYEDFLAEIENIARDTIYKTNTSHSKVGQSARKRRLPNENNN